MFVCAWEVAYWLNLVGGMDTFCVSGDNSLFMQAFHDKGRVSPFLKNVPVYAVLVEDLGERGAHWGAVKVRKATVTTEQGDGLRYL